MNLLDFIKSCQESNAFFIISEQLDCDCFELSELQDTLISEYNEDIFKPFKVVSWEYKVGSRGLVDFTVKVERF